MAKEQLHPDDARLREARGMQSKPEWKTIVCRLDIYLRGPIS